LTASRSNAPDHRFLVTSHASSFVSQARVLFGEDVEASVITLPDARPAAVSAAC
jgi:hypothetical protein